jgi:hypothetical protein
VITTSSKSSTRYGNAARSIDKVKLPVFVRNRNTRVAAMLNRRFAMAIVIFPEFEGASRFIVKDIQDKCSVLVMDTEVGTASGL